MDEFSPTEAPPTRRRPDEKKRADLYRRLAVAIEEVRQLPAGEKAHLKNLTEKHRVHNNTLTKALVEAGLWEQRPIRSNTVRARIFELLTGTRAAELVVLGLEPLRASLQSILGLNILNADTITLVLRRLPDDLKELRRQSMSEIATLRTIPMRKVSRSPALKNTPFFGSEEAIVQKVLGIFENPADGSPVKTRIAFIRAVGAIVTDLALKPYPAERMARGFLAGNYSEAIAVKIVDAVSILAELDYADRALFAIAVAKMKNPQALPIGKKTANKLFFPGNDVAQRKSPVAGKITADGITLQNRFSCEFLLDAAGGKFEACGWRALSFIAPTADNPDGRITEKYCIVHTVLTAPGMKRHAPVKATYERHTETIETDGKKEKLDVLTALQQQENRGMLKGRPALRRLLVLGK